MPLGSHPQPKLRCGWLLAALLFLVIAVPFVEEGSMADTLLAIIGVTVIATGIITLAGSARTVLIGLALGALYVGVGIASSISSTTMSELHVGAATTPFAAYTAWIVLRYVLRGETLNDDKILGAVAAYLLICLSWAGVYAAIEIAKPGSFVAGGEPIKRWGDYFYYSVVTITTLGYGDMLPVSRPARAFAALEAVSGVFYMSVIVARFVGLYSLSDPDSPD